MAITLGTSVKLMDNMSSGFTRIINAVNLTVSALRKMSSENVKISGLEDIQRELNMAGAEISVFKDGIANAGKNADNLKKKVVDTENATEEATNTQRQWNRAIHGGKNAMSGLLNKLKAALGLYALIGVGKKLVGLSDQVVTIDARLNLITDNTEQKRNLKNAIYKATQDARAPINDFTNSVAKLGQLAGKHFANNGEIIKFSNLMAKSFKISGASAQEAASAMYQLNQAMASGRLQGDEFRSIIENAPMLAQGIAKAMGVGMEKLKQLSSDGAITADVIKKAVFGMEKDINEKFAQMPLTWKDVWTQASNFAIRSLEPLLKAINRIANSKKFQALAADIANTFEIVAGVMTKVFDKTLKIAGLLYDKWNVLKYPIGIVIGLVSLYTFVQGLASAAIGAYNIAVGLKAAAETAASGATFMATAAQHGFNAAIYAFPGTWIVVAIVAVIAILAALVTASIIATIALIKLKTGTMTVTGTIVGSFRWMAAHVWNAFADMVNGSVWLINKIISGLNKLSTGAAKGLSNFANYFIDAFNHIMREADKFLNGLLQKMSPFAPLLNAVGFNLPASTGGAFQLDKVDLTAKQIPLVNNGNNEIIKKKDPKFEFEAGAAWGNRTETNFINGLKGAKNEIANLFDPYNLGGGKDFEPSGLGDVGKNTGKTADNTGKMADSLEDTEEEMKYLRELAEQEHINQFTTAEIKVEMNNSNTLEKDADIDDVIRKLTEKLEEKMNRVAEGVY